MNIAILGKCFRRIWKQSARSIAAALATGLLLVAGGVVAAPAQALAKECPRGYFCFWVNDGFLPAHAMGMVNKDVPDLAAYANPLCPGGTWSDCISSIYNNTDGWVNLYDLTDYILGGDYCCPDAMSVRPGQAWGSMPTVMGLRGEVVTMIDSISSIKLDAY